MAVVEQGPQPVGARQCRAGVGLPSLVQRDACHGDMHDRARHIMAEARFLDERLRLPCVPSGLAPGTPVRGQQRQLRRRGEEQLALFVVVSS